MAAARYGPNVIITNEEVEKHKDALRNVSDYQLRKRKQLLLEGGKSLTTLVNWHWEIDSHQRIAWEEYSQCGKWTN